MKKRIIVLVVMIIFLISCKSSKDINDISKEVFKSKGYSAVADITVTGNKGISKYKVKQYYLNPDKLRIETIEPDFLKNKILILSQGKWKIHHPLINQNLEISELKGEDTFIFMGVIQKNTFTGKDSRSTSCTFKDRKCIMLKSTIPGGNRFRHEAALYIDENAKVPLAMDILDDEGTIRIEVKYSNFIYKEEFKDSLFTLE